MIPHAYNDTVRKEPTKQQKSLQHSTYKHGGWGNDHAFHKLVFVTNTLIALRYYATN